MANITHFVFKPVAGATNCDVVVPWLSSSILPLLATLIARLTFWRVVAFGFVFFSAAFLADCAIKPRYPSSLPRVGYGDGVLATLRNWLGYVLYFGKWVDEGYHKYSKHGHAFVVPSAASRPQEVVVPRTQTAWMLDQPDNVLSTHAAHDDVLYNEYNFLTTDTPALRFDHSFQTRVVHRNLARHLPSLLPAIEAEVVNAVEAAFGSVCDAGNGIPSNGNANGNANGNGEEEWHTITLWDAWLSMVPQITNRLVVGADNCRNSSLLKTFVKFADVVVTNSFILNMFPKLVHPLIGRLVRIPNQRHWRAIHTALKPMLEERLKQASNPATIDQMPEDLVTWLIRTAVAEGRSIELDTVVLSKRLLPIEFAAIHTTVLTGHFVMMDLLASDPSKGYLEALREEVQAVRGDSPHWTKDQLSRLLRTDSAIRESMRVSNFATSLVKRKVVSPKGVTNKAEGWHVPYGSLLMLNLAGIHHDAELYTDPDRYDAFRFARMRGELAAEQSNGSPAKEENLVQARMLGMVTTSDRHLAFGHGRHACPGRFFVAHELKMILAYLVTHFEFRPLETRAQPFWIGQTIIPPLDVKIQIRRRKQA